MISVNDVNKHFAIGKDSRQTLHALKNIRFSVNSGEICGLLGKNGAGKSTTMRVIVGLLEADTGDVILDGIQLSQDKTTAKKKLGYLPHNSGLYPRLTGRENILYFAKLCNLNVKHANSYIDELSDRLSMEDIIDRRVVGFSQGQKAKIALARSIIHRPKIIVLDEPTSGLDIVAIQNFRELLRFLRDEGACILLSSHLMQEVEALCDKAVIISEGKVCFEGEIEAIRSLTNDDQLESGFIRAIAG